MSLVNKLDGEVAHSVILFEFDSLLCLIWMLCNTHTWFYVVTFVEVAYYSFFWPILPSRDEC
jgi:hypothetical protein